MEQISDLFFNRASQRLANLTKWQNKINFMKDEDEVKIKKIKTSVVDKMTPVYIKALLLPFGKIVVNGKEVINLYSHVAGNFVDVYEAVDNSVDQ